MGEEDRQDATRTERATERPTMHVSRRLTVSEAADELGISAEAVRSRLKRGTLRSIKEGGTVYVLLPAPVEDDQTTTGRDQADAHTEPEHDRADDQTSTRLDLHEELVEELRDQVAFLRRELEARTEEARRKDHIIMSLTQWAPALAPPRDEPRGPETDAETSEGTDTPSDREDSEKPSSRPRSGWRRLFGLE